MADIEDFDAIATSDINTCDSTEQDNSDNDKSDNNDDNSCKESQESNMESRVRYSDMPQLVTDSSSDEDSDHNLHFNKEVTTDNAIDDNLQVESVAASDNDSDNHAETKDTETSNPNLVETEISTEDIQVKLSLIK